MKNILIFTVSLLILTVNSPVFSQTDNEIDLISCLESGIKNHPFQSSFALMDQTLETQHKIADAGSYPVINWNTTTRIQSESISLEFNNPMLPSFEVPLYSFTSALELNYVIYDGGYKKQLKATQLAGNQTQKQQLTVEIDQIKSQIVQLYLGILFLEEKDKILKLNLDRIKDNQKLIGSLEKHGLTDKSMILHWEVKEMELKNLIESNKQDRLAWLAHLESAARTDLPDSARLKVPAFAGSLFDGSHNRNEIMLLELHKRQLDAQSKLIETATKPKLFAYGTAGIGYPNPLNFFDDQMAFYALGGIGVSWKFYDWGKTRKDQQVIKLQQAVLDNQQRLLEENFSQQDEKYFILINKYRTLIDQQAKISEKMEEIVSVQKSKLENGTLLPVEYLRSLNDLMEIQLKLSQYQLELIKAQAEFLIIKGKL